VRLSQFLRAVVEWQFGWLTMDVGVKRLDPLILRNVQNGVLHHLERVVVDEDVDGTHLLQRKLNSLFACFRRSQIRLVHVDLAAAVLDHLLCLVGVALLLGEVCDCDFGSLHCVEDGDTTTDARVAACDQGFAAFKLAGGLVGLHAAIVGRDLVYFGERIHTTLQARVVLALRRWGLPA
jgi:hypothetical protein